ncbi:MAG: hypothetical protein JJ952_03030 [Pseudomonadales bacterium]|nr:hypothetical protein [Pseudomonadales bacterium]MBO6821654.1 hypothetical protein [Pseudomonadales bacterium]
MRVVRVGTFVVASNGRWHVAERPAPTHMPFITPGKGALNAVGGDPV